MIGKKEESLSRKEKSTKIFFKYQGFTITLIQLRSQFSSVAQLCLTLCDLMDCSTPGFPVHHQLLELTHVHWVSDAIQPSYTLVPFSSCLQSFSASGSFQMSQFFTSEDLRENHYCKPLLGSLVENVLYSIKMWLSH